MRSLSRTISCHRIPRRAPAKRHKMLRTLGDIVRRSKPGFAVGEDATVLEISSSLSLNRLDAMAVIDKGGGLVGIVTAKDITKCIARGLDCSDVDVRRVMTPHPMWLGPNEKPERAVKLMQDGGFRHCPVVGMDGRVIGVVDCLSLVYDAILRLQQIYSAVPTKRTFRLFREARENIEKPTLRSVVGGTEFVTSTSDVSVRRACEALASHRASALVVVNDNGVLKGIFSCSDVMTRVVAKGLNPDKTILQDVMTRNPEFVSPDITILDALQRMQACGFRHLPVVEMEDGVERVVALVDVLQLASDALLRNSGAESNDSGHRATGFWGGLFTSFFGENSAGLPDKPGSSSLPQSRLTTGPSGFQKVSPDRKYGHPVMVRHISSSVSDQSVVEAIESAQARDRRTSRLSGTGNEGFATFKFKDYNGEYRRIKCQMATLKGAYDRFIIDLRRRFDGPSGSSLKVKYIDEDGDEVLLANDEDLFECFSQVQDNAWKTVKLKLSAVERSMSPRSSGSELRALSRDPSFVSSQMFSRTSSSPKDCTANTVSQDDTSVKTKPEVHLEVSDSKQDELDEKNHETDPPDADSTTSQSMKSVAEAHKLMIEGDTTGAVAGFTQAIALDATNTRAYLERGAAKLINGDSKGAEQDYRRAIELVEASKVPEEERNKTHGACLVGLAETLIDQRRYEEAAECVALVKSDDRATGCAAFLDELTAASEAASKAIASKEWGSAASLFTNAMRVEKCYLSLRPSEKAAASLRLGRAKCYLGLEDWEMALEDYDAAISLDQESIAGFKGRGRCLSKVGKLNDALEAYKQAAKLDPADPEVTRTLATISGLVPDPLLGRKANIAKLGGMLANLNLTRKPLQTAPKRNA